MRLRLPSPDELFAIFITGIVGCLLALAMLVVSLVYSTLKSDHKVDYCWISASRRDSGAPTVFYVNQHRPYTQDAYVGPFDTVEQALDTADKLKCPTVAVEP